MYMQAPRDKLVCALNCCRVINNLLHVQVQGEARGKDSNLKLSLPSEMPCSLNRTRLWNIQMRVRIAPVGYRKFR